MNEKERSLLQQIGRTGRAMYTAFEAEVGQPLPRWRILQALREKKCATQKELAHYLLIDPGALTRQMKALEADGLVTRQSAPEDNRLTAVALTPAGADLIESTQPMRRAFSQKALQDLPAERLDIAMSILKCLEDRFRSMHGE
jgi:DNA-binding MarR family transcriptional regulator